MNHDYYYYNGLRAWKKRLQKELRLSMARYSRLERQHHPVLAAQGKWITFQKRVLAMIQDELPVKDNPSAESERIRARGEHHRAVIDALDPDPAASILKRLDTWNQCHPKGSLNYDD